MSTSSALTGLQQGETWNSTSQCSIAGLLTLREAELFWVPIYIGTNAGWFLLGIILIQTYNYWHAHSKNSSLWLRLLVYATVAIAILETASDTFVAYYGMVLGWGDPLVLFEPTNMERAASDQNNLWSAFDVIPAIFVQSYFTWRIWTFSIAIYGRRMKWIVAMTCLFIALNGLCAVISAVLVTLVFFDTSIATISTMVWKLTLLWTATTSAADVTITGCMIVILRHAKARASFSETRDKISRLLILTIQTGFLTSIFAVCTTILSAQGGSHTVYTLPLFFLGKSYTITLLANMNFSSARDEGPAINATSVHTTRQE